MRTDPPLRPRLAVSRQVEKLGNERSVTPVVVTGCPEHRARGVTVPPRIRGDRTSEQAQFVGGESTQRVVVDLDADEAAALGQHSGLGLDDLSDKHPAHLPEG